MRKCNENICLVCRSCQKVNKICELRKAARNKCNQTWSRRVTLPKTFLLSGPSPALTAKPLLVTSPRSLQQEFGQQISPKRRLSWPQSTHGWEKSLFSSLDAKRVCLCCKVRCPPAQGRWLTPTPSASHLDPPPNQLRMAGTSPLQC